MRIAGLTCRRRWDVVGRRTPVGYASVAAHDKNFEGPDRAERRRRTIDCAIGLAKLLKATHSYLKSVWD